MLRRFHCISFIVLACSIALAQSKPLLDGRVLDGQIRLPGVSLADLPAIESEIKQRLGEAYLKNLAGHVKVQQGSSEFVVRQGLPGSFTRSGAQQKAYLYRLGLTSGVVVLEDRAVVAHYNGIPSEYAHYIYAQTIDLNSDGLTDLVLNHNTEDSEAIEAHLFLSTPQGPRFLGSTAVFTSNVLGGDPKPNVTQSDAYVVKVQPGFSPKFSRSHFRRSGAGKWLVKSSEQPLKLDNRQAPGYEPKLLNLSHQIQPDQASIQLALGKLTSYSDVASSLVYTKPANPAQALVAADPGLRLMELLDTRAALYAVENATKRQVDHRRPQAYALSLQELTTVQQVRQAYIDHTNESLGGMSPYSQARP
ncbi:MAG: hypothetical protein U0931_29315 [Vulcanimicrobiota bacterium]